MLEQLLARVRATEQDAVDARGRVAQLEQACPPPAQRSLEQRLAISEARVEAERARAEAERAKAEKARAEAERARAEAEKESAEAEKVARVAAEAKAERATQQMLQLTLGSLDDRDASGRGVGHRGTHPADPTVGFVSKHQRADTLVTPSKASPSESLLAESRSAILTRPVSLEVPGPSVAGAFDRLLNCARNAPSTSDCGGGLVSRALMVEANYYELATSVLPPFVERVGHGYGQMSATALFSVAGTRMPLWSLPGECYPELHVRGIVQPDSPAGRFVPGYSGELETSGDKHGLEQAVFYAVMDMTRIFFPAQRDDGGQVAPCKPRYFHRPPVAYALVAFPHVGYYVAIEMIGKLLVSPISAPFFLGSDEHRAAANALPAVQYAPPLDELNSWEDLRWSQYPPGARYPDVLWTVQNGTFFKVVQASALPGAAFASMHRVYSHLADALASAADRPASLPASVKLMYGANQVLVTMPAVVGQTCTDDNDVLLAGEVLNAVADAVVWLARHRIVYVDLRAPNVIRSTPISAARTPGDAQPAPAACLVDFDDCLLADAPVVTLEDYATYLQQYRASVDSSMPFANFFAARFLDGACPAVRDALDQAFLKYVATATP